MERADQTDVTLQDVWLFLDEAGTSANDAMTLVGATAFQNVLDAEMAIRNAYHRALGDASIWPDETKRRKFAETGFHFTEDSESVRQVLLAALSQLEFRAYVAYARNDLSQEVGARLVAMYGTLLSSVLARYRETALTVVFEQNSTMDPLYGKLWNVLTRDVALSDARAFRGTKSAPCLAATDYVLGVTRIHLAGNAHDFQENRYVALGRNLAYLIDFDDDRHLGGNRHPIV
ncbi:hypothetical protein [Microbacterium radiodurans]|uniref:DUF3800 domain-containing protein n=1 Tax=Microbacterium radiodurans TaxID=661398 RepID=A0A5J5IPR4_9MICO|nr:hypothetical protein [Microbacterium radiodurans]KAA9085416.1 hypothetical protein F6B42_13200 [Microbacterium radiodurans]